METRLYQDGLSVSDFLQEKNRPLIIHGRSLRKSSDGVEDCSFVVWIRREETIRPEVDSTDADAEAANKPAAIPRLAKRAAKMVICRARCQVSGLPTLKVSSLITLAFSLKEIYGFGR